MKLAAIVLIRNEADIFPSFAQHLAALFDIALFMDHNSTDGTSAMIAAACAARPGWTRWHVTIPGLHQSLFTSFAIRHVFATTDADAIFLLDADEFIDVPDRTALHAAIAAPRPVRCAPCLAWRNALPHPITGAPVRFGDTLLLAPGPSPFTKVIVTRALYDATGGALTPHAGSHEINPGDGQALPTEIIGTLLHLPLRTVAQMERKTLIAALAHLARSDRKPHEGSHRFAALERLAEGGLTTDDLRGWAAFYGEAGAHAAPKSIAALLDLGFVEHALDVAHDPLLRFSPPPVQTQLAAIAAVLRDWRTAPSGGISLALTGDVLHDRAERIIPPARDTALAASLAIALAERDAARSEIAMLRASTSWRITGPLRALRFKLDT